MKGCPTNLSTSHEMGWWGPRILFLSELARGSCAKIALPHRIGVVMALRAVPTPDESSLTVNVYDGTRQAFPAGTNVLYRGFDGNQNQLASPERPVSSLDFSLPFSDNFGDTYSVIGFPV